MASILQLRTKVSESEDNDESIEPVSPTGQYLSSKAISLHVLGILELEVPIDESYMLPQLQELMLSLNRRISSIMIFDEEEGVRKWEKVEVKFEDHVIIPSFQEGLSIECNDKYFDEYLANIAMDPLPQDKPLWEIHIFKYPTSKAVGQVIFKLHHAIGDGYTIMGSLLAWVRRVDYPSRPLTFPSTFKKLRSSNPNSSIYGFISGIPRCLCAIYRGVADFSWGLLKSTLNADSETPIRRSTIKGPGFRPNIKFSTIQFSLDQIKVIKSKLGMTVNDVLSGIIFYGIRLYMNSIDTKSNMSQTTAMVLLNTRNIDGYVSIEEMNKPKNKLWGNQIAFLHVEVPKLITVEAFNPLQFVYEANKQMKRLKNSPGVYITAQFLECIRKCRGPEVVAEQIYNMLSNTSLGISNVMGPIEQVSLADHPIKGIYFTVSGDPHSLGISIMSYMNTLRIALKVETDFIDCQRLISYIKTSFQLMYEEATKSK